MGATDGAGRVESSLGGGGPARPRFAPCLDVPNAGALLALPALLANGLLSGVDKKFQIPPGFYGLPSIFLLLGFMALARVKSVESLRYGSPGEWGKILGLDRAPEVRTLREKLRILWDEGQVREWSADLAREWLQSIESSVGAFYVDGHVRVYHGAQTELPKRYVSRERLALRGTTDYWVNAWDGQPVFVVTKPVDPGLVQTLRDDIAPRLLADLAGNADSEGPEAGPSDQVLTLVFDREGYSPALFAELKKQRIACLTYRRRPGEDWSGEEFQTEWVTLANGEGVEMKLAERGVFLKSGSIWAREIRRLSDDGHQTPVVTTDYRTPANRLAARMFGRWAQENFFRYMTEHYGLNKLSSHRVEDISDTVRVVNPAYRDLETKIRRNTGALSRLRAKFGQTILDQPIEPAAIAKWETKKAALLEKMEIMEKDIQQLKAERKQVPQHISCGQLPDDRRFTQLHSNSKHFIDMIKMIAYRAESAMTNSLREGRWNVDDARSLLRSVYCNEADLDPDPKQGILHVRLHHMPSRAMDDAVRYLCNIMNETETVFPQTNLQLTFSLGSN